MNTWSRRALLAAGFSLTVTSAAFAARPALLALHCDAQLIDAMASHPKLIERPILVAGGRAVIGRPPEKVLEILP